MKNLFERMNDELNNRIVRSAWDKGKKEYALELIEGIWERSEYEQRTPRDTKELELWALNGASSWNDYSYGGSSLIYDTDIAQRLCTQSELKKTRNGERNPNSRETWLDCQARALFQAMHVVKCIYNKVSEEVK